MAKVNPVTPAEVLAFAPPIADGSDPGPAAATAVMAAESLVSAYCRGRELTPLQEYRPGIREVVIMVAARILANPSGLSIRVTAGGLTISKGPGFQGFTLGEQAVLNRYRKRAVGPQ